MQKKIIGQVKSKYWKTMHKFGIEIPKSVEHALEINLQNRADHWRRAIEKEMKNVIAALECWNWDLGGDNASTPPIGYQQICSHVF